MHSRDDIGIPIWHSTLCIIGWNIWKRTERSEWLFGQLWAKGGKFDVLMCTACWLNGMGRTYCWHYFILLWKQGENNKFDDKKKGQQIVVEKTRPQNNVTKWYIWALPQCTLFLLPLAHIYHPPEIPTYPSFTVSNSICSTPIPTSPPFSPPKLTCSIPPYQPKDRYILHQYFTRHYWLLKPNLKAQGVLWESSSPHPKSQRTTTSSTNLSSIPSQHSPLGCSWQTALITLCIPI